MSRTKESSKKTTVVKSTSKSTTKPAKKARSKSDKKQKCTPETELNQLLSLRADIKTKHGSTHRLYRQLDKKIQRVRTKMKASGQEQKVEFSEQIIEACLDQIEDFDVSPKEYTKAIVGTYGGRHVIQLDILPDEEEAQMTLEGSYTLNAKIEEGGILEVVPMSLSGSVMETKMSNDDKKEVVHVLGWSFGRDHFNRNDAYFAFNLLFNDNINLKKTGVMKIYYTYLDNNTQKKMTALVGAAILNWDMALVRHEPGKEDSRICPSRSCKVFNMVQFGILEEFNQRNLGGIAMKQIEYLLKKCYGGHLLWWCGCAGKFYNHCGYSKDPPMINIPFNIDPSEERNRYIENREMFYYVDLGDGESESRFQRHVLDPYKRNPNLHFSIAYRNVHMLEYYGLFRESKTHKGFLGEQTGGITGLGVTKRAFRDKFSHTIFGCGDEVYVTMLIPVVYDDNSIELEIKCDGSMLSISGIRKDRMGNTHYFLEDVPMDSPISADEFQQLKLTREDDGNLTVVRKIQYT